MISRNLSLLKILLSILIILPLLNSCGVYRSVDAKDYPPDPEERVQKNMEEGRGFKLFDRGNKSNTFDFATSNSLWRASLDTINFMPLLTADYGGGIIVTDWFNNTENENQALKISIQFLSNEIRADALLVKIFKKSCGIDKNCKIIETNSLLNSELKLSILRKAAVYEKETKIKNKKSYKMVPSEIGKE